MSIQSPSAEGWQLQGSSAEAYERYLASAFSPWASLLVSLADVRTGERVLDVACGTGIVARHAAQRTGAAGTVVGLDVNEDMLTVARSVSSGVQPPIEWRHGNAAELPFPASTFDAVFCEQALQFFVDPVKALREMHRVMTPAGRAAVSVCRPIRYAPAYVVMANALDRYAGAEAGAMMRSVFSTWNLEEFRSLFTEAGFQDVRATIEVGSLRYPSSQEFLRREAASSPLAGPITALSDGLRKDLIRDLDVALADHVDDAGVVCLIESYVALARA